MRMLCVKAQPQQVLWPDVVLSGLLISFSSSSGLSLTLMIELSGKRKEQTTVSFLDVGWHQEMLQSTLQQIQVSQPAIAKSRITSPRSQQSDFGLSAPPPPFFSFA